jgi:hypothetical protein
MLPSGEKTSVIEWHPPFTQPSEGKHEVELQASLVGMLKLGWDEIKIMKELGMTLEEVQRLIGLKGCLRNTRSSLFN